MKGEHIYIYIRLFSEQSESTHFKYMQCFLLTYLKPYLYCCRHSMCCQRKPEKLNRRMQCKHLHLFQVFLRGANFSTVWAGRRLFLKQLHFSFVLVVSSVYQKCLTAPPTPCKQTHKCKELAHCSTRDGYTLIVLNSRFDNHLEAAFKHPGVNFPQQAEQSDTLVTEAHCPVPTFWNLPESNRIFCCWL